MSDILNPAGVIVMLACFIQMSKREEKPSMLDFAHNNIEQ